MGFEERNDAFDFWASLLDFSERVKAEETPVVEAEGPNLSHLRLQEGQTISLGSVGKSTHPAPNAAKIMKLKPPPK
jgi:hypothetical protein